MTFSSVGIIVLKEMFMSVVLEFNVLSEIHAKYEIVIEELTNKT